MMIVYGLPIRAGVSGDQSGRLVWAEVPWQPAGVPAAVLSPPAPHPALSPA